MTAPTPERLDECIEWIELLIAGSDESGAYYKRGSDTLAALRAYREILEIDARAERGEFPFAPVAPE